MQHVVNEWSTKYIQQSLTDDLSPRLSGCIPDIQYRLLLLLLLLFIPTIILCNRSKKPVSVDL